MLFHTELFFNGLSLKKKLSVLYLTSFLLPLVFFIIILNTWLYRSILQKEIVRTGISLNQTKSIFEDTLSNTTELSDRLYLNKTIQEALQKKYTGTKDAYETYMNISFLNDFLRAYKNIISIRYYSDNPTLLQNSFFIQATDSIKSSQWYTDAIDSHGHTSWILKQDDVTGKEYLSLVRSIWNTTNDELIGVLSLNINPGSMARLMTSQPDETLIMLHTDVAFSSIPETQEVINTLMDKIRHCRNKVLYNADDTKVYTNIVYKGKKNAVFIKYFQPPRTTEKEFLIVSIVPMKNFMGAILQSSFFCILLITILAIVSFLSIQQFSLYFQKRVNKVRVGIQKVVQQNFEIAPSIGGMDEFSDIYDSLVLMTANIKQLVNKICEQKTAQQQLLSKQNDIRFKMLAAQINPHFLFNTLELIRMSALANNNKNVANIIKLLAKILRYNLSVTDKTISLYSEIEVVSCYLDIQHMRFGNRFTYDIIPTCDIRSIEILPLLIQPVVENSFAHGLKNKSNQEFLLITIDIEKNTAEQDILVIRIKDNGCGIPADKLASIRKMMDTSSVETISNSIGLVNICQRIKLYYGQQYGVDIASTEGNGTVICLRFPVKKFRGENINV
jgi:two-component system, sensor histidine kinase YesM